MTGTRRRPVIAVTMGDPGGIGPEVALRAAAEPAVLRACAPVLLGDLGYLDALSAELGLRVEPVVRPGRGAPGGRAGVVRVLHTGGMRGRPARGKPSAGGGLAAGAAIESAVELALSGGAAGVCTAPASKESLALAGYGMVGHTEVLARLTRTRRYAMMLARSDLRVVFATTHVPVSAIARRLTRAGLMEKMDLAADFLRSRLGIKSPRLGVCCLNPHCGEGGGLGGEEKRVIIPAVRAARRRRISAEGPFPADSIFGKNMAHDFDAVIAMYHDQGMIPLKMVRQHEVVNVTLGIPFVRTSPGHGTAFDIAGRGVADHRGMVTAVIECAKLAGGAGNAR